MTTGEIIGVIAFVIAFWVVMILVGLRKLKAVAGVAKQRPGAPVAVAEVLAGQPFELEHVIEEQVPHHLFLEYCLRAERLGGNVSQGIRSQAGMAIRLQCFVDGDEVGSWVIGKGSEMPCEVDRIEQVAFYVTQSADGAELRTTGTMPVMDMRPRPVGTEIVLKGTVVPNAHTEASRLRLFISR